jgi:hypothetical protein
VLNALNFDASDAAAFQAGKQNAPQAGHVAMPRRTARPNLPWCR